MTTWLGFFIYIPKYYLYNRRVDRYISVFVSLIESCQCGLSTTSVIVTIGINLRSFLLYRDCESVDLLRRRRLYVLHF